MKHANDLKNFQKKMNTVSTYFKELRYAEKLTQAQVGSGTGLHRNTISAIENFNNFELRTLFQLCEFYQLTPAELLSILDEE